MGSVSVLSSFLAMLSVCVLGSCVHHVTVLNDTFCMTCHECLLLLAPCCCGEFFYYLQMCVCVY